MNRVLEYTVNTDATTKAERDALATLPSAESCALMSLSSVFGGIRGGISKVASSREWGKKGQNKQKIRALRHERYSSVLATDRDLRQAF